MTTADLLSRSELFSELSTGILSDISGICHEVKARKGEFVFRIGDPSKELFVLAEGAVDLGFGLISAEESKGGVITEPGQVFGWGALAGEMNYRLINAMCVEETRLVTMDGSELMKLLEGRPAAGFIFLRKLLAIVLNRMVLMAAT